jgi:hypothetical protein
MRISYLAVTLVTGLLVAASGCGRPTGKVTGKVSYQEQPVVVGSVTLMAEDGVPFQGQIQPDGTFQVAGVPYGTYRVSVFSSDNTPPAPPTDAGVPPEVVARKKPRPERAAPAGWFPIPERYGNFDQSGLAVTIDKAEVSADFKLTE